MKKVLLMILIGVICLGIGFGSGYLIFHEEDDKNVTTKSEDKDTKLKDPLINLDDEKFLTYEFAYENGDYHLIQNILQKVDKKILEDKYKNKITEANEYADEQFNNLKKYYGKDLEDAIMYYTGYNSVKEYLESLYISYLSKIAVLDELDDVYEDEYDEYIEKNKEEYYDILYKLRKDYGFEILDENLNKQYEDYIVKLKQTKNEE